MFYMSMFEPLTTGNIGVQSGVVMVVKHKVINSHDTDKYSLYHTIFIKKKLVPLG